ncbi:MAG: FHA domain-containing protein [Cyanosarcina radialis HA8281-LM2]|jgi:hypothetical protein|nr:FHA domain-containing protein [Cyanosarcina radialis HA8281-LM2]
MTNLKIFVEQDGKTYILKPDREYIVGSSPDCNIPVSGLLSGVDVASQHLKFSFNQLTDTWHVYDLGSSSGTFINARLVIESPIDRLTRIAIANSIFLVAQPEGSQATVLQSEPPQEFRDSFGSSVPESTPMSFEERSSDDSNPFATSMSSTWLAWKILVADPVGGLAKAFHALGEARAFLVGIVCSIFYVLSVIFLVNRVLNDVFGLLTGLSGGFGSSPSVSNSIPLDVYIKLVILALLQIGTLVLGLFLARKVSNTESGIQRDIFGAGVSFLPLTLLFTLIAVFGIGSMDIILILITFASCISIVMTYHSFTLLSRLAPSLAIYAVPLTSVISYFVFKLGADILF